MCEVLASGLPVSLICVQVVVLLLDLVGLSELIRSVLAVCEVAMFCNWLISLHAVSALLDKDKSGLTNPDTIKGKLRCQDLSFTRFVRCICQV